MHTIPCARFLFQHFPSLIRLWMPHSPFDPGDKFWTEKNGSVSWSWRLFCVCVWMEGDVCGISGSSRAVNSQLKPGLCLWSAWSKRRPGATVGRTWASYTTTHQPPDPYPDLPHSLVAYSCLCVISFRQITPQISETDLCYRNTI